MVQKFAFFMMPYLRNERVVRKNLAFSKCCWKIQFIRKVELEFHLRSRQLYSRHGFM